MSPEGSGVREGVISIRNMLISLLFHHVIKTNTAMIVAAFTHRKCLSTVDTSKLLLGKNV